MLINTGIPQCVVVQTRVQVVLVNQSTASTSEMLASALHANGATLIGERTLGKGRTQKVFELPENFLLFVSVLGYKGASGETIDALGLEPDIQCSPQRTESVRYIGGDLGGDNNLRDDPCIDMALTLLASWP
jgi:carboxyl-terminal processing protease